MTPQELERRIHDYVDGELDAKESAAFEEMLAADEALQDEVASIRGLIAMAQDLPPTMAPPSDMWPALHEQIEHGEAWCPIQKHKSRWFLQPTAWAAAVLLLIAGSASYTMFQSGAVPDLSPRQVMILLFDQDASVTNTVVASFRTEESAYLAQGQELRLAIDQHRRALPPELMATIDENLNIIDAAIEEMRVEFERDPSNDALASQILELYQRQLSLLQKARSLSSAS